MHAISSFLEVLEQQAHPEGGWGYAPGQRAQLEPTCFGILALSLEADKHRQALDNARDFLAKWAGADGSYRLANGREEAVWPTALVLFVQTVLAPEGGPTGNLEKTAGFLLGTRGMVPDAVENGELHDIDVKLTGWPWAEKNFSWVEPTAWACIALRHLGQGKHARVQEGLKMLLDRAMDAGGINYGNRRILGRLTDPIPGPSALMLLAVQPDRTEADTFSQQPRTTAACAYLMSQLDCGDLEQLCWVKLALDLYRAVPGVAEALARLDAAILAAHDSRAQTNWLPPAPLRQALTASRLPRSNGISSVCRRKFPPRALLSPPIPTTKLRSANASAHGFAGWR